MQAIVPGIAQGVDVSAWQGSVNWRDVSAHKAFAYARASAGPAMKDVRFLENWVGIRAAGLLRGTYHYAVPAAGDARAQALFFAGLVRSAGGLSSVGDLPPVLDFEENPHRLPLQALLEWAEEFCTAVDGELAISGSHRTMLYGPHEFLSFVHAGTGLSTRPLWLSWPNSGIPPNEPAWDRWTALQYSFRGTVPGIAGAVDLDVWAATREELQAAFGGMEPVPSSQTRRIMLYQHTLLAVPAEELAHEYGWIATDAMSALSQASDVLCIGGTPQWIAQAKAACKGIWHEPLSGPDYWLTLQKVAAAGQSGRF